MTAKQVLEQLQLASLRKAHELHGETFNPEFYDQRKKTDRIINRLKEAFNDEDEESTHYKKLSEAFPDEFGFDVESSVKYFENLLNEMPSIYQDPISYDKMKKILDEILEIYNSNFSNNKKLKMPVFGSTQVGAYSSYIVPVGKECEPLLVYSDAFFHLSHLMNRIIAMTVTDIEITERGTFLFNWRNSYNHIRGNKKLQMRFLDIMFAQIIYGEPFEAETFGDDISFGQRQIAMRMDDTFIAFVLSHEFSHYANGDINKNKNIIRDEKINYTSLQESQADELAVKLTSIFVDKENNLVKKKSSNMMNTSIGILCAFCSLNLVEKVEKLKSGYSTNLDVFNNDHPPVNDRIKSILSLYSEKSDREMAMWYLDDIINVFSYLWEVFLKYYDFITSNCHAIFNVANINIIEKTMLGIAIYNEKFFDMALGVIPFETRIAIDLMINNMTYPFFAGDKDMFAISNFDVDDEAKEIMEHNEAVEIGDFDEEMRGLKSSFGINLPMNLKDDPRIDSNIVQNNESDKDTRPIVLVRDDEGRSRAFDVLSIVKIDDKQYEVISPVSTHANKRESNILFVVEFDDGRIIPVDDKNLINDVINLAKNNNPKFDIIKNNISEMVDAAPNIDTSEGKFSTIKLIDKDTGTPFRLDFVSDIGIIKNSLYDEEDYKTDYPEIFSLNFDVDSITDEDTAINYSEYLRKKCFISTKKENIQSIWDEYETLIKHFQNNEIRLNYAYTLWYGFQNDNNWLGFKDKITENAIIISKAIGNNISLYIGIVAVSAKILSCQISYLCNNSATGRVGIHEIISRKFNNQLQKTILSEDDIQKIRIYFQKLLELANITDEYEEIDDEGDVYVIQNHLIESALDIYSTIDDELLLENTRNFIIDCLSGKKGKPYFEHADCLFTKKENALLVNKISVAYTTYDYSFQQDDIIKGVKRMTKNVPDVINNEVINAMAEHINDNVSTNFYKTLNNLPSEIIDNMSELQTNNRTWNPTLNTGKDMLSLPMMINESRKVTKYRRLIGSTQDFLGVRVGAFISLGYAKAAYIGSVEVSEFNVLKSNSDDYIPIGKYIVLWLLHDETLWNYCLSKKSEKSILSYFSKECFTQLYSFNVFMEDGIEIIDMIQGQKIRYNIIKKCLPIITEILLNNAREDGNIPDFESDDNNESLQVIEMFDGEKRIKFKVLDSISIKGKNYLCLSLYSNNNIENTSNDVFIVEEKENKKGGKSLIPVKRGKLIENIFTLFKEKNKDKYDFN